MWKFSSPWTSMCQWCWCSPTQHTTSPLSYISQIISPPFQNKPTPFLLQVVAKGAFLSRSLPIYAAVHAVMLSKKHQRKSSSVQEEGHNKWRQTHTVRSTIWCSDTEETVHSCCTLRDQVARHKNCRVGGLMVDNQHTEFQLQTVFYLGFSKRNITPPILRRIKPDLWACCRFLYGLGKGLC